MQKYGQVLRTILLILALCSGVPAANAGKIALVIGNNDYPALETGQLAKAVNDARAVGDTLEEMGFSVIRGENLGRQDMVDRVFEFTQRIAPGDTAVFFYAGHGVALDNANYLLPTDVRSADIGEAARIRNMSISEADILADIQERKALTTLVVLDACRDDPFRKKNQTRSLAGSGGLARTPEATGVFAIYSAGFGQTALDGLGEDDADPNSVFTRVFIKDLPKPGQHLADMMIDVRQRVAELAQSVGHKQNPAYYDQTQGGAVYLSGAASATQADQRTAVTGPVIAPPVPQIAPRDRRGSVGRIWYTEENDGWHGIWTRRGTSDTFDGINYDALEERFDLSAPEMTITGKDIHILRHTATAVCIYTGELSDDQLSAKGTYGCNHVLGRYNWTARIEDRLPEAPKDDWRGQVWRDYNQDWPGEWKRRGLSPIFDAVWNHPSGAVEVAPLHVSIDGDKVIARRMQEKGTCLYRGRRQADKKTIRGKIRCDWVPQELPWHAEIVR